MDLPQDAQPNRCKRPLLAGGLLALVTAALVLWLPGWGIWLCLLPPIAMPVWRRTRRLGAVALALAVLMGGYRYAYVSATTHLDGQTDLVVGQVVTAPQGHTYVIRVTDSTYLRAGTRVAVNITDSQTPALYETVTARVQMYAVRRDQRHYAAQGVYVYAYLDTYAEDSLQIASPPPSASLYYGLQSCRTALVDVLRRHLTDRESGVLAALCFGQRDYVSPSLYRDFQASGLSHILVVSGLHLSAVVLAVPRLLRRLLGKRAAALTTIVAVWLFALLVGATPSVLRAAMMCTLWLVGDTLFCRSDGLNSLGLAALVLLVSNPYTLYNVSFQLSFAATAGVLLLARRLSPPPRRYIEESRVAALCRRLGRAAWSAAAVSGSALAFTVPIACYHFGGFPLLAIPANLLAVGVAGVALMAGWLGALLGLVPFLSWLSHGPLLVAGALAKYMCRVARWMSPDWGWISTDRMWQWLLVGCVCGVAVYGVLRRVPRHQLLAGLLTLLVLTAGVGSPLTLVSVRMTVLPAGDGGGVWLQQGPHSILLVSHSSKLPALQSSLDSPAEVVLVANGALSDADLSDEWADTTYVAVGAATTENAGLPICPAGGTITPWRHGCVAVLDDAWYLLQAWDSLVAVCVDPTVPCPVRGITCVYLGGAPDVPPATPYTVACSSGWLRRHSPALTGRETVVTQDSITLVPRMGEWSVLPWL